MGRTTGRGFRPWLAASTASVFGDSVTFFAIGWAAAGFGADAASLVLTIEGFPLALLVLVGGVLADRIGIRRTMAVCDAAMVLVMAAFALGAIGGAGLWMLIALGVVSGTIQALRRPAEGVFPRLFGSENLDRRMALVGSAHQIARAAGPAVGGFLIGHGGLPLTAGLDAATFAVVLAVLLAVRPPHEPEPAPRQGSVWRSLVDGMRTATGTLGVVPVLVAITGLAATVLPLVMLALPLAGRERGWTAAETGLVSGAWVAGGLVMSLAVARWGAPRASVAVMGPALAAGGVVLLAVRTELWTGVLAIGLVGVGTTMLTSYLIPAFVASTPPEMLARFSSLTQAAQTVPVLIATPVLGVAAGFDLRVALAVIVALLLATVPAAARVARLPRRQELEPVSG
ncbi:Major Facilitator Superfamily protein [Nocardioides sp. YR527]|uniref:MFS transporter n=1 Tax=Nocardioides sp. YR527 TaxID=1881028 RepID=UPI00088F79E9|nr:MFS transporter [Nocardioides sp. YR527]SDJ88604.1 Major Facilitator Superfamily protein [Nocardioides sp. YR527]